MTSNVNTYINKTVLIERLTAILNREEENIKALSGEQKKFSEGYAEGIADIISMIEMDDDFRFKIEMEDDDNVIKVIDDNAWWADVPWGPEDEE